MPGSTDSSTKTMGALTIGGLVAVTAYTVALGSNGWLWFGWVVLGLITLGLVATRSAECTPGWYFGSRTVIFMPAPTAVSMTRPWASP